METKPQPVSAQVNPHIAQRNRRDVSEALDLSALPQRKLIEKAQRILMALRAGADYRQFRGKRLKKNRALISIPLGLHYRLLCMETRTGLRPLRVLSHSAYNAVVREKR